MMLLNILAGFLEIIFWFICITGIVLFLILSAFIFAARHGYKLDLSNEIYEEDE